MTTVERRTEIDATVEQVWAALADFAAISTWAESVDHSSLMTAQESGVGAVRRIQSGRITLVEEVVTWEPNSELAYTICGVPVVSSVRSVWRIEPANGGTHVSLSTDVDGRPPVAALVARGLGKAGDSLLAGLKEYVE